MKIVDLPDCSPNCRHIPGIFGWALEVSHLRCLKLLKNSGRIIIPGVFPSTVSAQLFMSRLVTQRVTSVYISRLWKCWEELRPCVGWISHYITGSRTWKFLRKKNRWKVAESHLATWILSARKLTWNLKKRTLGKGDSELGNSTIFRFQPFFFGGCNPNVKSRRL